MASAKDRKEALDSQAARMFQSGVRVTEIMRRTGSNYTRVHNTLVTAGLVNDADTDD